MPGRRGGTLVEGTGQPAGGHLGGGGATQPGHFADGRPITSSWLQLLGYLVTLLVVAAPAVGTWFLTESIPLTVIAAVQTLALVVLVRARTGVTPGGLVTGTRAARREDHLAPGLARESVRSAVSGAAHVTVIGGLVLALSGLADPDRRHRGWQDRLARTRVLPARRLARAAAQDRSDRRVRATAAPVPADRIDLGREVTRLGDDPRHGSGARRR